MTSKHSVNSLNPTDGAKSRDFEKTSVSRVGKTAFDIMERTAKIFSEI